MMGAIGRAQETAERERSRKTNLAITLREMQRQREIEQREKEDRAKREAGFIHDAVTKEWSDPRRWKGSTPEEQGAALFKVNTARKVLGLDEIEKLQDPRMESFMGMWFDTQKQVSSGVGVGPDGTPSELLLMPFEEVFGEDYLRGLHIDRFNRELLGLPPPGMEGMELPGQGEPAGEKPEIRSPSRLTDGIPPTAGKSETGEQPAGEGQVGQVGQIGPVGQGGQQPVFTDWRTGLLSELGRTAVRPLTREQRISRHTANVEALVLAAHNPQVTPEQLVKYRARVETEDKRLGLGTDLDMMIAAVEQPTEYQKVQIENIKMDNLRAEATNLESEIRRTAATGDTWEKAQEMTRAMRERLYDLRQKMGWGGHPERKAGELPENYGMVDRTTFQQDRTYDAMMLRIQNTMVQFQISQELAMQRLGISQAQLDLAIERFEAEGGAAGDKYGRSQEAIEFALATSEANRAKELGFSQTAILHGPKRVREFLNAKDDLNSKWWEAGEKAAQVTAAGKARVKKINESEKEAVGGRKSVVGGGLSEAAKMQAVAKMRDDPAIDKAVAKKLKEGFGYGEIYDALMKP